MHTQGYCCFRSIMGLSHYLMSLLIYKNGPCRFMKKITTRSAALTPPLNITQTLGCLGYNHTDMLILVVFIFLETDLKLLDGLQSCNVSVL